MNTKDYVGIESLEKRFGPVTVGFFIKAFRQADGYTQTQYARKLKISRANLCDIEKGRKLVSPERAARFGKILGVGEIALITLALEDILRASKLKYRVEVKEIKKAA